ncbi:MAG: MFS transporter [Chloroflexi bacterium]|nr:MFS transporter [Chloroflexota bacterium]
MAYERPLPRDVRSPGKRREAGGDPTVPRETQQGPRDGKEEADGARDPVVARFDATRVGIISLAHFIHDCFPAFLAPLLPLLTAKLGFSLAAAGALVPFLRSSAFIQPAIGYLADRTDARLFVILAPTVTAVCMSLLGIVPTYWLLPPLLILAGLSISAFHAPAMRMITQSSGRRWGTGMSFFMTGGEMGRSLGPLYAVTMVGWLGLDRLWLATIPAIITSLLLIRFTPRSHVGAHRISFKELRHSLSRQRRAILALLAFTSLRSMATSVFILFLPTYLVQQGSYTLLFAGTAVSTFELAGALGALSGGTLSDRWGRRTVLMASAALTPPLLYAFLSSAGWAALAWLLIAGAVALCTGPVGLTMIQELLPDSRSTATSLMMSVGLIATGAFSILFGAAADLWGIGSVFRVIIFLPWVALLFALGLPETHDVARSHQASA